MFVEDFLKSVGEKEFMYRVNSPAIDYYKFIADINSEIKMCDDYKEGLISFSTAQVKGRQHFIHTTDTYYTLEEQISLDVSEGGVGVVYISFKLIENEEIDMNLENKLYKEAEDLLKFLNKFTKLEKLDIVIQGVDTLVSMDLFRNKYNAFYNIAGAITEIQRKSYITIHAQEFKNQMLVTVLIDIPTYLRDRDLLNETFKIGYAKLVSEMFTDRTKIPEFEYEILTGKEAANKPMYAKDETPYVLYSIEKIDKNNNLNINNISNLVN